MTVPTASSDLSARYTAAIRQYTSADNVSAFVRNVVLRLIPRVLWGSKNNFMAFCQAVHTFVHLRRFAPTCAHHRCTSLSLWDRFESIDVTFIMQRLRTKDCSWLGDGVGARAAISKQYAAACGPRVLPLIQPVQDDAGEMAALAVRRAACPSCTIRILCHRI